MRYGDANREFVTAIGDLLMNRFQPKVNQDILTALASDNHTPFALLHRPDALGKDNIDVLLGEVSFVESLADISLPDEPYDEQQAIQDKLVLLPYRQITERGFQAVDDDAPLAVMDIQRQEIRSVEQVLAAISDSELSLAQAGFDMEDTQYAAMVRQVLEQEIGRGKGASFVLKRSFTGQFKQAGVASALSIFKNLMSQSSGAYWVFIVHTGERTLVGATPERHITLKQGTAVMNPISGTYRYPPEGVQLSEIKQFLTDKKEADELYMVVDEELKTMAQVCDFGGTVKGPMLKEMPRLAHTEYFIRGQSSLTPIEILKATMFAPSVTGSPQESATRVIHQYEPAGRGYYSGVVALIGRANGQRVLDSSILIRTADIDNQGQLTLSVGATLVRGSDADAEMEETKAKAAGLLAAIGIDPVEALFKGQVSHSDKLKTAVKVNTRQGFANHPEVLKLLAQRNEGIAKFWLTERPNISATNRVLSGKRVLIVDAEDTFTVMIAHQLTALGCETYVYRFDQDYSFDDNYDLVVMGPGPGDPRNKKDAKVAKIYHAIEQLLARGQAFLAVCLSHQVLSATLGLPLIRRNDPNQGVQKQIDLFGNKEKVGFYNTFAAFSSHGEHLLGNGQGAAQLSYDPASGEVHAIRGHGFCGVQFHPESILTMDGVRIFEEILVQLCGDMQASQPALNLVKVA